VASPSTETFPKGSILSKIPCVNSWLKNPVILSKKIRAHSCSFVVNFSMNDELRTMNSLRDHLRKGVARSLLKTGSIQRNFCQFFEIFTNFYQFLAIFTNFPDRLAHLIEKSPDFACAFVAKTLRCITPPAAVNLFVPCILFYYEL